MKWVSAHAGKLIYDTREAVDVVEGDPLSLPGGCVHELLSDRPPRFVAAWLAAKHAGNKPILWCEPHDVLYPPALIAAGIDLANVYLVRASNLDTLAEVAAECMRCRGVGVTVALLPELDHIAARRLQLAARGGCGVGLLMRPPKQQHHAASTRWHVSSVPGARTVQRWQIEQVHGPGIQHDRPLILERDRHAKANRVVEWAAEERPQERQVS